MGNVDWEEWGGGGGGGGEGFGLMDNLDGYIGRSVRVVLPVGM